MKIKVNFNERSIYDDILEKYPLGKIVEIMSVLDWVYHFNDTTPTLLDLKSILNYLLVKCDENSSLSSGGFYVEKYGNLINVHFEVANHFYTKKTTYWGFVDLVYFSTFIDRIKKVSPILESGLDMLTPNNELDTFFKGKCDNFINMNRNEFSIPSLGLYFNRENYPEENTIYNLTLKCYNYGCEF